MMSVAWDFSVWDIVDNEFSLTGLTFKLWEKQIDFVPKCITEFWVYNQPVKSWIIEVQ